MDRNIEFFFTPSFLGHEELSLLKIEFNKAFDFTDSLPLTDADDAEYKSSKEELEEMAKSFIEFISDYVTEL